MSPIGKREFPDDVECDIALQTSQLGIYSPSGYHSNKRTRYDHTKLLDNNRMLDNLCSLPCSVLADIDLEVHKADFFFFFFRNLTSLSIGLFQYEYI
jgi:hypothetical protein